MIDPRLKKLEAIAGMPKTFFAFNMPMARAASETSRIKGNMMRVSWMVSSALSGAKPGARTVIRAGANRIPTSVTALMKTRVSVATLLASLQADSSLSVAMRREKVVTKAVERAPSAKRSRNMLGARKAVRNASMFRVAPNKAATTISRINPRSRLQRMAIPTMPVARVLTR